MRFRVLIADDQPLHRQRLRQFVQAEPDAELVAECTHGLEALAFIRQLCPDLALLEIKMPGLDGFEVLNGLPDDQRPAVIFVTASHRFAVRAFEANAVDYLLKPFDQERFRSAFRRARQRLRPDLVGPARSHAPPPVENLLASVGSRERPFDRVAIKANGRISMICLAEIDWIKTADNYVELHVGRTTYLLRKTLTEFARQLPPSRFARISRSHLVNLSSIREIRSKSHGDYLVVLHDNTALAGSRHYRQNLAVVFGGSGFP